MCNSSALSIVASPPPARAPVYYLVPFVLWVAPPHQNCHCSLPQPDVGSVEVDKSEIYTRIQKDLIKIMDGEDKAPGGFKLCNQKLHRRELVWNRVVKKLLALFLVRNDHTGRICSAVIGA